MRVSRGNQRPEQRSFPPIVPVFPAVWSGDVQIVGLAGDGRDYPDTESSSWKRLIESRFDCELFSEE